MYRLYIGYRRFYCMPSRTVHLCLKFRRKSALAPPIGRVIWHERIALTSANKILLQTGAIARVSCSATCDCAVGGRHFRKTWLWEVRTSIFRRIAGLRQALCKVIRNYVHLVHSCAVALQSLLYSTRTHALAWMC